MKRFKVVKRGLVIRNKLGLHARPAAVFVQMANKYESDISVTKGSQTVNGKSIMGIMMLAAAKGSRVFITAKGIDAQEAVDVLAELLSKGE